MKLAAGIINYRTYDDVLTCVESLRRAKPPPDRILVADNSSEPAQAARLRSALPDRDVLASPENRGYAGGANAILRETRDAEFTLLLNPDVRVSASYCGELL